MAHSVRRASFGGIGGLVSRFDHRLSFSLKIDSRVDDDRSSAP
jgi:hypothetical protein